MSDFVHCEAERFQKELLPSFSKSVRENQAAIPDTIEQDEEEFNPYFKVLKTCAYGRQGVIFISVGDDVKKIQWYFKRGKLRFRSEVEPTLLEMVISVLLGGNR